MNRLDLNFRVSTVNSQQALGFFVQILNVLALSLALAVAPAWAAVTVSSGGPGGQASTALPDAGGAFTLNQSLSKNAVNKIVVTAVDAQGHRASKEISVTQVSLDSIVVSKVTTERLSVEQVTQLVNEGVIKLDNPENFNVSTFDIVLTIGSERVPVSVPIAVSKEVPEETGYETYQLPQGDGSGGGRPQDQPPVEIVVFQQLVAIPDSPPITIPGVIIIEGNIRTLKEFYTVRLLLMNTSGIFTLKDVQANISFPDGGLSKVLPVDGMAAFGDIGPGEGGAPGQAEKQFIIRGDDIGIRKVKVDFGGSVVGPGIAETEAIPFNGSANAEVEVKGPPEFQVRVTHPDAVERGVPYELKVEIANVGDLPALYASLELDVGADANLTSCNNDTGTPVCQEIEGAQVRNFGHIMPGGSVAETFTVLPKASGPVSSCVAAADQNIKLQVYVGDLGCLVGSFPPKTANPDGIPTVNVLPTPNTQGVGLDTPVTGFFSEAMNLATLTTGAGGTFNVYDRANNLVAGKLRKEVLNDKTVVIWQVSDGITNRLSPDTEYTVVLSRSVFDLQGNTLANDWTGKFTTTATGLNDTTPPTLTLLVRPPVNPNHVIPGETVQVEAYASDQGSGIARVELRRKDLGVAGASFELTDQKSASKGDKPPYIFSMDSAALTAGHNYRLQGTAYDKMGNSRDATLDMVLADNAQPPAIVLPADPAEPVLKGISVLLNPVSISGSASEVRYYLDGAATPFKTVTLAPFQASLSTLNLAAGSHAIRAVARDGLGQQGEDSYGFQVSANPNQPSISFTGAVSGAEYRKGDVFTVRGSADDPVGIQSLAFFLDNPNGTPLASGNDPFTIDTSALALGMHRIYLVATNNLGTVNDINNKSSYVEFSVVSPPPGVPPAAPQLVNLSGPVDGLASLTGVSAPGSRIDASNAATGIATTAYVNDSGQFNLQIPASVGDTLNLVAYLFSQSPNPSIATTVKVVAPPLLIGITVAPTPLSFNTLNASQDLTVTGHYSDGSQANLTAQSQFGSDTPTVAGVSNAGRVAALADGSATVTAMAGGFLYSVPVTVATPKLIGLSVNPSTLTFIGSGQSQQLAVSGIYSDGGTRILPTSPTFLSTAPAVATVTAGGLVSSGNNGTTDIQVSYPGLASVTVSVTIKTLSSISLSPAACDLIDTGKLCQLGVTGTYSDGSTTPLSSGVGFVSANPSVATVNSSGLVTSAGIGNTVITASYANLPTAQATVTVKAKSPVGLQITPSSLSMTAVEQVVSLTPLFQYNDGTTAAASGVSYVSKNTDVAKVSADGTVTAAANGSTTIEASASGFTAVVPVTVNVPPVKPTPIIYSIDRPRAGEDDPFVLRGKYFGALPKQNLVKLNGITANVLDARDDELKVIVPHRATSGPVTVTVAGQAGNAVSLDIYARRARSFQLTPGADGAATPSQKLTLTLVDIDFRDGDVAYLSSAPDAPVPLDFAGDLTASVDGGTAASVAHSAPASEITGLFQPGIHTLTLELPESGGQIHTGPIHLMVGPAGTGTLAGERSVLAAGMSLQTPVTFVYLRDYAGNPLPDGTKVLVSTLGYGNFTDPNGYYYNSVGGNIVNGENTPAYPGVAHTKAFTVAGGRIDVVYDSLPLDYGSRVNGTAHLVVLPADAAGNRTGSRALAIAAVQVVGLDTVSTSRSTSNAIADGFSKIVSVTLGGARDTAGNRTPDGVKVMVSTLGYGNFIDPNGYYYNSAGGSIVNGAESPDYPGAAHSKIFTLMGAAAEVQYDPDGILLGAGQQSTANLAVLPATPEGRRVGNNTFQIAPIGLSSAVASQLNIGVAPASVLANYTDNRVVATVTGITDATGNPAPDGTRIVVSTLGYCYFTDPNGYCYQSAGGSIINGDDSPDYPGTAHTKVMTVQGGQFEIVYSSAPVAVNSRESTVARMGLLPSQPNGRIIGNKTVAIANVTLNGYDTFSYSVNPPSTIADGLSKIVDVSLTGFKDVAGTPVPDGAKVVVTTLGYCYQTDPNGYCYQSAGGNIVNGAYSSDYPGNDMYKVFTVMNGRVSVQYDSASVLLDARQTATANLGVLPAGSNGKRIGPRTFGIVPVTLSSVFANSASLTVSQPSVLADYGDNRVVASLVGLADTLGYPAPDGTSLTASTLGYCYFRDGGYCYNSFGGNIVNGLDSPDYPNAPHTKVFTLQDGKADIVYSAASMGLRARDTQTASIGILPAKPDGHRIGIETIARASVVLAGYQSGDVGGPGSIKAGETVTYTLTNLLDTSGKPIPDGAKIMASTLGSCYHRTDGYCFNSAGGTLLGGANSPTFSGATHSKVYTVTGGQITVQFQAPAGSGTSVLHFLPAAPDGRRIGDWIFAAKSIVFGP
ncbi:MAG: Ig-like domain-containing protein [Candidatus Methylumidiphilus sp.]